jgi:hypothetical protein
MISNVFSPRGVLLAFLVVIFSASSAAASDARLLHDLDGGATRSLQEASLDGVNDLTGARRVLLKKGKGRSTGGGKTGKSKGAGGGKTGKSKGAGSGKTGKTGGYGKSKTSKSKGWGSKSKKYGGYSSKKYGGYSSKNGGYGGSGKKGNSWGR